MAASIINFGSVSWKLAQGGDARAYTSAKAAVHGLTRGLARDFGKDGIRVNTVVPGWVMTERQFKLWVTQKSEKQIDQGQCLKGRVQPTDLAAWCCFWPPTMRACARPRNSPSMAAGSRTSKSHPARVGGRRSCQEITRRGPARARF